MALGTQQLAVRAVFAFVFGLIPRLTPEVLAGASRRFPVGCERETPCRQCRNTRCIGVSCTRLTPGMMFATHCFNEIKTLLVIDGSSFSSYHSPATDDLAPQKDWLRLRFVRWPPFH